MATRRPGRGALAGAVAGVLALTGCTQLDSGGSEPAYDAPTRSDGTYSGTLAVGGATTQAPPMAGWTERFTSDHPQVEAEYRAIGSGRGRAAFVDHALAVAGSDVSLLTDSEEYDAAAERCGSDPVEVPAYARPVVITFNIPGMDHLNLSPDVVADLFTGEIARWNSPRIAATNPGRDLPDLPVTPVHRSDPSGTTAHLTDYLTAVAGNVWPHGPVESWPEELDGQAAEGTSGVLEAVRGTEGAVGYAAAPTDGLGLARIGVGGEFSRPYGRGAAGLLEGSPRVEGAAESQLVLDLDHRAAGVGTYPIMLVSYLLACTSYQNDAEAELVAEFLGQVLSEQGQQRAAEQTGSAPLPESLRESALEIVGTVTPAE